MKSSIALIGTLAIAAVNSAFGADAAATDPLTKLPLPTTGAPIALFDGPNKIEDVPVCKAKGTMNFYSARSGNVSAALSWYSGHLTGFKHVHGFGSGRSQDTFYSADGTLTVSITGEPGRDGQDTKVYSIIYSIIRPGVTEKVIAGMNIQKVVCP